MTRPSLTIAADERFQGAVVPSSARPDLQALTGLMVASGYAIGLAAIAAGAGISIGDVLAGSPTVAALHLLAIPLLALPILAVLIGKLKRRELLRLWGPLAYVAAIFVTMAAYGQKPFDASGLELFLFSDVLDTAAHLLPPLLLVAVLTWLTVELLEKHRAGARKQLPLASDNFRAEEPQFAAAA